MPRHQDKSTIANFWLTHLKNWQSSGLHQNEYCAEHRLNTKTFWRWKRQLMQTPTFVTDIPNTINETSFIPLSLVSEANVPIDQNINSGQSGIRLIVANKHVIELAIGFDSPTLKQLLELLA